MQPWNNTNANVYFRTALRENSADICSYIRLQYVDDKFPRSRMGCSNMEYYLNPEEHSSTYFRNNYLNEFALYIWLAFSTRHGVVSVCHCIVIMYDIFNIYTRLSHEVNTICLT